MARTFVALNIVPLLVFPLILYNFVVLSGIATRGDVGGWMMAPMFIISMLSGDAWSVSFADAFLGMAAFLYFVELVKATRTDAMSIINHGLATLLFVVCVVQLLTVTGFATTPFFMLTLLTLLDVVAGFTVTIVAAKRDFGAPVGIAGTN